MANTADYERMERRDYCGAAPRFLQPGWHPAWIAILVLSFIFFWPLAIPAFNHALKVHPLWSMGDVQGAQYSSQRAAFFGKLSLIIFGVFIVLYLAFIGLVVSNM